MRPPVDLVYELSLHEHFSMLQEISSSMGSLYDEEEETIIPIQL
jgi:hypothetical protein